MVVLKVVLKVATRVDITAAIVVVLMEVIAVVLKVDMVAGIMEATQVGANTEDLTEVSMGDMADMAVEGATMAGMVAGVADLVARVAQHVDKQFTKSVVSIAHDPHGMFKSDSRGHKSHSGARARIGSKSVPTVCPRCQSQIVTLVKRRPDAKNVVATAGAVALSLIFDIPKALLPLALLPMQLKSLHKTSHYCPRCNYKLGKNIKISIPMDTYHD
ncbi:hypothetical protein FBU31_001393 [Coemansia sp. 'formosensis']|nr:hypothetical protein FBU31_001393 [Coemansia sp. 'formosensis']